MKGIKDAFLLKEQQFDSNSHLDSNMFYAQRGGEPETLSNIMVQMFGKANYPMSYLGLKDLYKKGQSPIKKIKGTEYKFPVMGKRHRPSVVAQTVTDADAGIGRSPVTVTFSDGRLKKHQIIQSGFGTQAHVIDRKKGNTGWDYTLRLHAANIDQTFDPEDLQSGTQWAAINTPVAEERARGSESNTVTEGAVKNQLSLLKKKMSWGNIQNLSRVLPFQMSIEDERGNVKSTELWMSWFMYQFEEAWMFEKENTYWYSRYNRSANGTSTTFDEETGNPINTGAGLLEQISNFDTYSQLTFAGLQNYIADLYYGAHDQDNRMVTIFTGRGGMREIDAALRKEGILRVQSLEGIADKFIKGEGYDLTLQGYFNSFYHIDGYYITVKYNPFFDRSPVADAAPRHPITGITMESYRMVFLDTNSYDGQPNIQLVEREDMPMRHWINLGGTDAPADLSAIMNGSVKSTQPPMRNSELEEGAYYRTCSAGIQLMRPNTSFNLECTLS